MGDQSLKNISSRCGSIGQGIAARPAMPLCRRLSEILVADVRGFCKLLADEGAGTLDKLLALRRDLIDPAIAKHGGWVFKVLGDAYLVEFASDVACAIEIQTARET